MKFKKIVFWVLTVVFAGMMALSAFMYLSHQPKIEQGLHALGYPVYILNLLGTAKIIGIIALLQTRFYTLKEWAYAGFFINLIGAAWSHLAMGQPVTMPVVLFVVLAGSYILWAQIKANLSKSSESKVGGLAI